MNIQNKLSLIAKCLRVGEQPASAKVVFEASEIIDRIESDNAKLQERVKELEKDKQRVDWIDTNDNLLDLLAESEQNESPEVSIRSIIDYLKSK